MKYLVWVTLLMLAPLPALADTVTFICSYTHFASPEGLEKVKDFKLTFVVDQDAKKSYIVGNNGSSEVQPVTAVEGVTFIETTAVGNVMTTTIDSKLVSVHSRHSILLGELLPSQYYGTCEIR